MLGVLTLPDVSGLRFGAAGAGAGLLQAGLGLSPGLGWGSGAEQVFSSLC